MGTSVLASATAWHWNLTPLEALGGYEIRIPLVPAALVTERLPMVGLPYLPFGDGLMFQYGVSSLSLAPDMIQVRCFTPGLPDPGEHRKERRSGILVFDGDQVVGYYIIDGMRSRPQPEHRVWVDPDYRGTKKGAGQMGARILLEYQKWIPRCHAVGQQLNPRGCETFLAVRPMLYQWAEAQGKRLSSKVRRELETGEEDSKIRRKIAQVRNTGISQII